MAAGDVDLRILEAELISRFADDVAHELRNPLNAVVINIEVLRRRVAAGDEQAATGRIDAIAAEVGRVHRSIERFLTLIRPPRAADLRTALTDAFDDVVPLLELWATARRARFSAPDVPEGFTALRRDRIRMALLASGVAAFDGLQNGGHLSCTVEGRDRLWKVCWHGPAGTATGEDTGLRLARAILSEAGGSVTVIGAGENNAAEPTAARFEIALELPAIA